MATSKERERRTVPRKRTPHRPKGSAGGSSDGLPRPLARILPFRAAGPAAPGAAPLPHGHSATIHLFTGVQIVREGHRQPHHD